jgi:hypothetical protein
MRMEKTSFIGFTSAVFDPIQSLGMINLKFLIYASFAVNKTQIFPAKPARINVSASK